MQDNDWQQALNKLCVSSRESLERQLVDYCAYYELKLMYQVLDGNNEQAHFCEPV